MRCVRPALALLPVLLLGCGLMGGDRYTQSPVFERPFDDVWTALQAGVKGMVPERVDKAEGTYESRWMTTMGYFRMESQRQKVFARVVPEGTGHRVEVKALIEQDRGPGGGREDKLDWSSAGRSDDLEQQILAVINLRLSRRDAQEEVLRNLDRRDRIRAMETQTGYTPKAAPVGD